MLMIEASPPGSTFDTSFNLSLGASCQLQNNLNTTTMQTWCGTCCIISLANKFPSPFSAEQRCPPLPAPVPPPSPCSCNPQPSYSTAFPSYQERCSETEMAEIIPVPLPASDRGPGTQGFRAPVLGF